MSLRTVSQRQYQSWKRQALFDVLRGVGYGKSFCDRFDIQDNILYYDRNAERCESYIKRHYLV